jgi:hypothetical protein
MTELRRLCLTLEYNVWTLCVVLFCNALMTGLCPEAAFDSRDPRTLPKSFTVDLKRFRGTYANFY